MDIGHVYMITSPSGKIYIGSSKNIKHRLSRYKCGDCKNQIKLQRSFNKYGVKNHTFEIIWEGDLIEMLQKESILGNFYDVLDKDKGLNLKLPKINDVYQNLSIEALENFRKGQLGRKHSEEVKRKISNWHKNNIFSETHKENIKISAKNKILTKEHRNKINITLDKNRKELLHINTNKIYRGVKEAALALNLTETNIYSLIKREKRNSNRKSKYKFKYIENDLSSN